MTQYVLLLFTWLAVLAAIVYFWIVDGSSPSVWLWIILAALSVIPLSQRLKVGSWFDFRKKGKEDDKQINERQEHVINIGNINVQLQSEQTAQAFAERLIPYSKPEKLTGAEQLTQEDKEVITFIYNVDQAIASLLPLLRVLYVQIDEKLSGLKLGSQEWNKQSSTVLDKDILFLMQEIKEHATKVLPFKDSKEKFTELFEPVEKLAKLRLAMDEKDAKPPTEEEAKALVAKVYHASGFLSGMFSVGMFALFAIGRQTH